MPLITLSNGTRFEAKPGSTVLDAAAAHGLVLEHSCRTGRCGSCKARVLEGSTKPLFDQSALSAVDLAQGWALTCAVEATSDATLDIEDLGLLGQIAPKTLPARICAIERLAPDVIRLELRLPPQGGFRFLAGQSIDLSSPAGVKRSYSLASDPASRERLELHIRRVPGGQFSDYCFERSALNDLLRFRGPSGTFFLRKDPSLHLVLLATGTGIAPMKSMLMQLAAMPATEQPLSITLYWGGRHEADLYFDPRSVNPKVEYIPVLSRADQGWNGARGHVQDVFMASSKHLLEQTAVYACGSEAMINEARSTLLGAGLPPKRFHYDAFVSSTSAPAANHMTTA